MTGKARVSTVRNRQSRLAVITAMLAGAARYCWAARRDEQNGFPLTAALEWRKAADLSPFPAMADQCWREWERIVRLPRRLAAPISDVQVVATAAGAIR